MNNECTKCNGNPCDKKSKVFPSAVIEIDNPPVITNIRKVVVPASMGDDTVVPPVVGKYHNVLLYYEANQKSYLYSSDGIPTQLVNGVTDYEAAINLPQINGNTLIGDKTGEELGLQDKLIAGDNITIEDGVISATDTTYGPATDTEIGLVKPGDGLEVDTDGTLSISEIEQYAHFFDTVADMKVADNLVAGSYAQTLGYQNANDGGDALYKIREANPGETADEKFIVAITGTTLVAELIIEDKTINVLTIGAGVSGQFSATVNYAIAKSNYKVYIPKGSYTAEATINLTTNNTIFECDGNISCNGVTPLFLVTLYRNVIRINGRCFGNNAEDSIFMQVGDDTHGAMRHNIYFHTANDFDYGVVYRAGNNEGCSYNTLSFDFINCNKVGILLHTSDTSVGYVTENVFNGGRIAGKGYEECIGIQTIKGESQTDPYNGNVFNHIAIDGDSDAQKLKHFIKLEYAYVNFFNQMRLFEGLGSDYAIVLENGSCENHFSAKYTFDVSKIRDDTDDDRYRNYFENGLRNGGSFRTHTKFFTQFGGFIMEKDFAQNSNLSNVSAYNTTTFTLPDTYVIGGTTVRVGSDDLSGTITFTLPKQFNKRCVNRFILFVTYKAPNTSFVINDSSNNEIVTVPTTTAAISRKSYMVEFTGNALNNSIKNWKVMPLDYNFE